MSSVSMHHLIMGDDEFEIVDKIARSNINDIIEVLIDANIITFAYPDILARTISGAYENAIVEQVGKYAFANCPNLTSVKFSSATLFGDYAFLSDTSLISADLAVASSLGDGVFQDCSAFNTLILRKSDSICTIYSGSTVFANTAIASGSGYIYVPSALVNTYKSASNWSTYSARFRALESYTADGTITGALDPSKI